MLDSISGHVTLWGSRGSSPTPGGRFVRHGGHTSCLSVSHGGDWYIFDAGSGIRELGRILSNSAPQRINLFITHTHWDHIQGFPFFLPAYTPGWEIAIYGAKTFGKPLKSIFKGQLDPEYFPVRLSDMRAHLEFHHVGAEPLKLGDLVVENIQVRHPGTTLGYKIRVGDRVIGWVPDNEFLSGHLDPLDELTLDNPVVQPESQFVEFLRGVDLLFHEAQYTDEEYPNKVGWGHSSVGNACALVRLAGVKRWVITHHDPVHDDDFLEGKLNITRRLLGRAHATTEVVHGYDGLSEYL